MTIALTILGALILIILLLHLAAGKEMLIEKDITIKKPVREVFDYLKITRNQDHFSVWNMSDPDMKKDFRGTDGQVGFVYMWDSAKNKGAGAGEQEIKKIEDCKYIDYELRFIRPMPMTAQGKFVVNSISSSETKMQWGFKSPTKFPMTIMKPVFKNVLGKNKNDGLANLKAILEK